MELSTRTVGSGRPLILMHGLFGSGDNWLSVAQKLDGWQVWLPDLRNHGSSPHADEFNFPAMAADILQLMDTEGLDTAVLAGHSMGGKVALETALSHPDRVEAVIAIDMAPKTYQPKYPTFVPAMLALDTTALKSRSDAIPSLEDAVGDKNTLQWLLKNLVQTDDGRWRWRLNLDALNRHYAEIWKGLPPGREFAGPTFFLHGGASDYLLPEDLPLIQDLFPLSLVETLPGAGHWLHTEKPTEFLTLFKTCLSRI